MTTTTEFAENFKQGQRKTWSVGDYPSIAELIQSASDLAVERSGAGPGDKLLDVATGSGNAAIVAARRGAQVTGIDLTAELLPTARERAAAESLEIEFLEGDAEDLPFDAGSFDLVTSVFGAMFAPRQEVAAAELVRVTKPGGTIVFTAWTPEGLNGQMFKTVGSHMPPPPEGFVPPVMWGSEDHVRGLFADHPVELEFERQSVTFEFDSVDAQMKMMEEDLGPIVMAKAALEPEGKFGALMADLRAIEEAANEATDGTFRAKAEYLLTKATVSS